MAGFLGTGTTGGSGGQVGVFVRAVGSEAPLFALNPTLPFEPASSIKALLLLEAVAAVEAGADQWAAPITVYSYPNSINSGGNPTNPNLCPFAADEVPANIRPNITLQQATTGMMKASDNTFTRAILLRYGGLTQALAKAAQIGMSDTVLQQDLIGCGYQAGKRNFTTLRDLSELYESVAARTSVAEPRSFFDRMVSGVWGADSQFASVLAEEAEEVGLEWSDAQRADFLRAAFFAYKGGSYIIPCSSAFEHPPACPDGQYAFDYSLAGVQTIPFKNSFGTIEPRTYTWGSFILERFRTCTPGPCPGAFTTAIFTAYVESFRALIHDALVTWKPVATEPSSAGPPAGQKPQTPTADPQPTARICLGHRATLAARAGEVTRGTPGPDVIVGTPGRDTIDGRGGNDLICSGDGSDRVHGGNGRDRIAGGRGSDRVRGGKGNDRLAAGSGPDSISGGPGRDVVKAGSGNDRISAADLRRDRVDCGAGRDRAGADRVDRLRRCEGVRRHAR